MACVAHHFVSGGCVCCVRDWREGAGGRVALYERVAGGPRIELAGGDIGGGEGYLYMGYLCIEWFTWMSERAHV